MGSNSSGLFGLRPTMEESEKFWYDFALGGVISGLVVKCLYNSFGHLLAQSNNTVLLVLNAILSPLMEILPNIIAVLLIYWFSQLLYNDRKQKQKNDTIANLMAAMDTCENVADSGLIAIYPNIIAAHPEKLIEEALVKGENIQILATMMEQPTFSREFFDIARSNESEITVIMLNPASEAAKIRSKELNVNENYLIRRIKNTKEDLERFNEESIKVHQNKINVLTIKYLDVTPGLFLCICGTQALVGFFCFSQRATEGPMLKVNDVPLECKANAKTLPQLVRREFEKALEQAHDGKAVIKGITTLATATITEEITQGDHTMRLTESIKVEETVPPTDDSEPPAPTANPPSSPASNVNTYA